MSAIPTVQARHRLGTGHVLIWYVLFKLSRELLLLIVAEEHKEWTHLRKAAHRNGRKFSKDDYIELLRTEDMDSLRLNRNSHVKHYGLCVFAFQAGSIGS